nr:BatD family protein [Azospirillum soli]
MGLSCCGTVVGSARAADGTDAASVVVRTSTRPDQDAVIGQHIRLFVDVLFRDGMAHPPRVTLPGMDAAQAFRFETQATSLSDSIKGRSYVGQRFEFALYARRGGTLVVPAATVTLLDRAGHETGVAHGTELRLSITVPPGVDPAQAVTASTRLSAHESWAPAPDTAFKAGDALVRTITREVTDVPGSALQDIHFPAPDGVRVYGESPRIDDKVERGEVTGERVDRATYVFEKEGAFDLPALSQTWWDLEAGRLRTVTFPAVRVTVAAPVPSAMPSDGASAGNPGHIWMLVGFVGGAFLLIVVIGRVRARLGAVREERRVQRQQSERNAFDVLLEACRGADSHAIYTAFVQWRDRLPERCWRDGEAGGARLMLAAKDLERSLFGGGASTHAWSVEQSRSLADTLRALRSDLLRTRTLSTARVLPPLNPAHPSST